MRLNKTAAPWKGGECEPSDLSATELWENRHRKKRNTHTQCKFFFTALQSTFYNFIYLLQVGFL